MQMLIPLAGVVIGGVLVMLTDVLRRRFEWRRIQLQRLLDNGVELLTVHHQLVGELVEAHDAGLPMANLHSGSADRYRVGTQFSATPRSESLLADVEKLRILHRTLRDSFNEQDTWEDARSAYVAALHAIEGKLRAIGTRGSV